METNKDITGVIVFKNEANRLQPLLKSILNAKEKNTPWLFVNDHSTDNSVSLIHEALAGSKVNYEVLDNKNIGKKHGIDTAMHYVKTPFVWLTDADTFMNEDFISHKTRLLHQNTDLTIGLVKYDLPKSFLQQWVYYETIALYYFILNKRSDKLTTCNGANLIVKVNTYLKTNPYSNNYHIPTGDDLFLLHAFKKVNAEIKVDYRTNGIVSTQYPTHWKAFTQQRIRWASKNILLKDKASIVSGLVFILLNLAWVTGFFFLKEWSIILLVKPILESILIRKLAKETKQVFNFVPAFFICLIEPLLIICLLPASILKGLSYKKVAS